MDARSRTGLSIVAGLLLLAGNSVGCGAIAVENGIFPLPTIHLIWPLPEQFGLTAESVTLTSDNGGAIYGWFIPAEDPRATVIIHHGALINRSATSDHYQLLNRHHYNVFAYDYQGFGESLVVAQLSTVLPDADAALAHVQQRDGPGSEKIILFGQSMGTLPAIAQAARSPDRVIALVIEGSFAETLPTWAFTLLGIAPDPLAYDRIPDELNSGMNIPSVKIPKHFIQSRNDQTTPIAGARTLYELATEPKSFAEVDGSHLLSVVQDPSYEAALVNFLSDVVGD